LNALTDLDNIDTPLLILFIVLAAILVPFDLWREYRKTVAEREAQALRDVEEMLRDDDNNRPVLG